MPSVQNALSCLHRAGLGQKVPQLLRGTEGGKHEHEYGISSLDDVPGADLRCRDGLELSHHDVGAAGQECCGARVGGDIDTDATHKTLRANDVQMDCSCILLNILVRQPETD